MNKKILLICSRISPGPFKVIKNLQGAVSETIDAKWVPLESIVSPPAIFGSKKMTFRYLRLQEYIKRFKVGELLKYNNNVFFVGWGAVNEALLQKLNRRGIQPSLIMCSTLGQSDFNSFERNSILRIIKNVKKGNIKHFLLNKRLNQIFGDILPNTTYFPYTIDIRQFSDVEPQDLVGTNVDIFCAVRPGKNVLNQILAFKLSKVSGNLHINFKNPQVYQFIKEIGVSTIEHEWLEQSEYYSLIGGMTVSLQTTFTESFSYAVAERMCLAVPVLTSFDIYLIAEDPFLSKHLCIRTLDTPSEIGRHIRMIAEDKKLRSELANSCRKRIIKIAEENNKTAEQCLNDIVS